MGSGGVVKQALREEDAVGSDGTPDSSNRDTEKSSSVRNIRESSWEPEGLLCRIDGVLDTSHSCSHTAHFSHDTKVTLTTVMWHLLTPLTCP